MPWGAWQHGPVTTTEAEPAEALPHWDTESIFPGLESRQFSFARESVEASVARLTAAFDAYGVRGGEPHEAEDDDAAILDDILPALNELSEQMRLVGAYLYAHVSTGTDANRASNLQSRFQADTAVVATLHKRFSAWVARVGAAGLVERSTVAADHAFALDRAVAAAAHQMGEAEEDLAAALALTGGRAWSKLHGDITSRLTVAVPFPDEDEPRELPMAAVRGLATDADSAVRRAAFDAELAAWETVSIPLSTALNAFKGEANTLNKRRGWTDSLDVALFNNNVDRRTLEAMQDAVCNALPAFARFNKAKARLLGHEGGLPWWDLLAPVGAPQRFDWAQATDAVADAFAGFSPRLAGVVRTAVEDQWLDAEPRPGKVGGAFCMPVQGGVSRVLLNFDSSFDSVQTLAHELGHAYHNQNLGDRTPMQRQTPMALAETASIFCETVMVQAGLSAAEGDAGAELAILDGDLVGATQVVVDIHSRFLFERAMTHEREHGVLSVDRLCELMTHAQREAYGDGVDHDHLHPWLWAVKGHYFTAYYNWPYTFGLLFGIGLYAEYQRDPDHFRLGYDDLLSATGLGDARTLAARFDIDVHDTAFWASSLGVLKARIDRFCELAAATA
jgi:pepF/M3 family oligoendopeptidase